MTRKETQFVGYLLRFYGEGGIYTDRGASFHVPMTRDEATRAATGLSALKAAAFEGDSVDREQARDLVLAWRAATEILHG